MDGVKGATGHPVREGNDRDPQLTLRVKQVPEGGARLESQWLM